MVGNDIHGKIADIGTGIVGETRPLIVWDVERHEYLFRPLPVDRSLLFTPLPHQVHGLALDTYLSRAGAQSKPYDQIRITGIDGIDKHRTVETDIENSPLHAGQTHLPDQFATDIGLVIIVGAEAVKQDSRHLQPVPGCVPAIDYSLW